MHTSIRVLLNDCGKTSSPACGRGKGPIAVRNGKGEGPRPAKGPSIPFHFVKRAPFFSRFAGEDEVRQIPDNAFEQKRCVNQIATALAGEISFHFDGDALPLFLAKGFLNLNCH